MHLELRENGIRDTEANAVKTARMIAAALGVLNQGDASRSEGQ